MAALFATTAPGAAAVFTLTWKFSVPPAPTATERPLQVNVLAPLSYVHGVGLQVLATHVTLAGSVSTTVTPVAPMLPAFWYAS